MGKLRRVAEIGDGTFDQMVNKNSQFEKSDLQKAKERKNNFSVVASKTPSKIKEDWQKVSGATRVERKSFNPEDFSSYDTRNQSIRRYETDEEEYETPFDTTITASYNHMFSDPGSELKEMLREAMENRIANEDAKARQLHEKIVKNSEWEKEKELWAQAKNRNIKSHGGINKTAHENVSDNRFGHLDYDEMEARESQYNQMVENMYQRHKSIKDSRLEISKEQRKSQWENDDNIRSQSIQQKANKSKLFNKLAQLSEN